MQRLCLLCPAVIHRVSCSKDICLDSSVPSKALFALLGEQTLFLSLCFGSTSAMGSNRLASVCQLALLSLPGTEPVVANPSIDRKARSSLARRGWIGIFRSKAVDSPCKLLGLGVLSMQLQASVLKSHPEASVSCAVARVDSRVLINIIVRDPALRSCPTVGRQRNGKRCLNYVFGTEAFFWST